MPSLATLRQDFIREITQHIPSGQIGLAVIDHESHSHVLVTRQGRVTGFGRTLAMLTAPHQNAPASDDTLRVTSLENIGLDHLATILDSFADPDFGAVLRPEALTIDNPQLPGYFQERLKAGPRLGIVAEAADTD